MAESRLTIRNAIRDKLSAWPDFVTTLAEDLDATETGVDLTAVTNLAERSLIEVDSEILRTISISGTTATVMRGDQGSSAATHSNGATVKFYPFWGWTDQTLNRAIDRACDWLGERGVWTLESVENSFLADYKDFGVPTGCTLPGGNLIKIIELEDDDGIYNRVYGWKHVGDRIVFNKPLLQNYNCRLWIETKAPRLASDGATVENDRYAEALEMYACSRILETPLANRSRYMEYSAALNDRASNPDELQRMAYFFYNQAVLLADQLSRPGLSGFISVHNHA